MARVTPEIKADIVGLFEQGMCGVVAGVVIECEAKATASQSFAGFDQRGCGFEPRGNSKNGKPGHEYEHPALGERLGGAGDEGGQAIGESFQSEEGFVVEHGFDRRFAILAKNRFGRVAKEQVVSVNAVLQVEDGLAGDIAHLGWQLRLGGLRGSWFLLQSVAMESPPGGGSAEREKGGKGCSWPQQGRA